MTDHLPKPARIETQMSVEIEPIPDLPPESPEWAEWCESHEAALRPLGGYRRAWCDDLSTYLRDATGFVWRDGLLIDLWDDDLPDGEAVQRAEPHDPRRFVFEVENPHTRTNFDIEVRIWEHAKTPIVCIDGHWIGDEPLAQPHREQWFDKLASLGAFEPKN